MPCWPQAGYFVAPVALNYNIRNIAIAGPCGGKFSQPSHSRFAPARATHHRHCSRKARASSVLSGGPGAASAAGSTGGVGSERAARRRRDGAAGDYPGGAGVYPAPAEMGFAINQAGIVPGS